MKRDTGIGEWRGPRKTASRLVSLAVALIALLAAACPTEAALRIGSALLPVTFQGLEGASVSIPDSVRGKVVILHFWQIGCSSCKLDMPAMDDLHKQYRKKGLEVLAVNVGQKREVVRSFAAELQASYTILIDPDEKGARLLGVADVPRTYIVDRKGIVRYRILGGATPETLKKLILSLL